MTFLELQQAVYGDTGYTAQPPVPEVLARVKRWINEAHRHILRLPSLSSVRRLSVTFSSVANQSIYGLPQAFELIDAIINSTNQIRLAMMSRDRYRLIDPGETATGLPSHWVPEGVQVVKVQPSSTGVWAVSSSSADITQQVRMRAVRANGDIEELQTGVLNGTTRVQLGNLTDLVRVTMWNLSAEADGNVSLYSAFTGGTELARIPIGDVSVQYQSVRLWPTPSAVYTFLVDGQAEIPELVNNTDVPLVPPSYHDLLQVYARMREYERTNDDRYPVAAQEFERGVTLLRSFIEFPPDYRPVMGRASNWPAWNREGGWYPAEDWP